jgi:hypothetical protein
LQNKLSIIAAWLKAKITAAFFSKMDRTGLLSKFKGYFLFAYPAASTPANWPARG